MSISLSSFVEYLLPGGASVTSWCDPPEAHCVQLSNGVQSLSNGSLVFGQSKSLYAALAGVGTDVAPILSPRGLPGMVGSAVRNTLFVPIASGKDETDNVYTPEQAADLVRRGNSYYGKSDKKNPRIDLKFVSQGEAFSAGWLRLNEISRIVTDSKIDFWEVSPGLAAALAAMESLVSKLGEDHVRLLFWFSR